MTYQSDKRLCLDADGNLVDCESEAAARLLVGAGGELTDAQAEQYGLNKTAEPEAKAQAPAANKARQPGENK